MYDAILVPTDGSPGTVGVLKHAIAIASDNNATIHGLYVVDRRLYLAASKETQDDVAASLEEDGETALTELEKQVTTADVPCETHLVEGIPHKEIQAYVGEADIDLVVMGTHGHSGPERVARLGSTTERVVENASVPVLVVTLEE